MPFAAGQVGWIRVTRVAASGLSNFYTSYDGIAWTLLGVANPFAPWQRAGAAAPS